MTKQRRKHPPPARTDTQITGLSFSGPLPPPSVLEKYNGAFPECAERIVEMAERQSSHRQDLERTALEANIRSERRGSVFGLIIALSVIGGGFWLISTGQDGTGIAAIITALASLVGVFVFGRRAQSKERDRKLGSL